MNSMVSPAQTVKFSFQNDILEAVRGAGAVWFPLRPLCDALGLDTEGQRQKLERHKWATTFVIKAVAGDGRVREMLCVDRRTIPMWLATIDASRLDADIRAKVEAYQCGIADVLDAMFFGETKAKTVRVFAPQKNYVLKRAWSRTVCTVCRKDLVKGEPVYNRTRGVPEHLPRGPIHEACFDGSWLFRTCAPALSS